MPARRRIRETQNPSSTPIAEALSKPLDTSRACPLLEGRLPRRWLLGHHVAAVEGLPMPRCAHCSSIPFPCSWVTVGSWRGMNWRAGFKNQSNPPFQGQTQVELHRVFFKRPPEPFCSSLLLPCSSQCTCERNN